MCDAGVKQKWVPMDIDLLKNDRRKKNFPPGRRDFIADRRSVEDRSRADKSEGEGDDEARKERRERREGGVGGNEREQGRPSSANARTSGGPQGRRGGF
jgi:hypothetical protein